MTHFRDIGFLPESRGAADVDFGGSFSEIRPYLDETYLVRNATDRAGLARTTSNHGVEPTLPDIPRMGDFHHHLRFHLYLGRIFELLCNES